MKLLGVKFETDSGSSVEVGPVFGLDFDGCELVIKFDDNLKDTVTMNREGKWVRFGQEYPRFIVTEWKD